MAGLDFKPISLGTRSNPTASGRNYSSRLINCFAVANGQDAEIPWSIYPEAGFRAFGPLIAAGAGIRGGIVVAGRLYVVAGRYLYSVESSGVATAIGGIPTDGPVYMAYNRREPAQIGIVSDGRYYVLTVGGALAEINDVDLVSPNSFAFLNGYGILPSEKRYSLTGLDDFSTIDALDFSSADAYPDDIVRVETLEGEAVFFGRASIEWHQDVGNGDFALQRSHATELGCAAAGSVARVDTPALKTLIWVAPDHTVRQMSGYSGQVISSAEISELLSVLDRDGDISSLRATAWSWGGSFRYALSCADWTRVYEPGRGWMDRKSHGLERWRVAHVFQFGNKLIGGDYATGQLYELRNDLYVEADAPMLVQIVTPAVTMAPYRMIGDALAINMLGGVGTETATDPKVTVEWSRDGGKSYHGSVELSLGRLGDEVERFTVHRLGMADRRGLVFRISIAADVFKRFDGAWFAGRRLAA